MTKEQKKELCILTFTVLFIFVLVWISRSDYEKGGAIQYRIDGKIYACNYSSFSSCGLTVSDCCVLGEDCSHDTASVACVLEYERITPVE